MGEEVELILVTEDAVDDLMSEGGIAWGEGLCELKEEGIGVASAVDATQDIEGDAAGGRDHCHLSLRVTGWREVRSFIAYI